MGRLQSGLLHSRTGVSKPPVKGHIVNILDFAGQKAMLSGTVVRHKPGRPVTMAVSANDTTQAASWILPAGSSLPTKFSMPAMACWSQLLSACRSQLLAAPPNAMLMTSHWLFVVGHVGSQHPVEASKRQTSDLRPWLTHPENWLLNICQHITRSVSTGMGVESSSWVSQTVYWNVRRNY